MGTLTSLLTSLVGFKTMGLEIDTDGEKKRFSQLINLTIGKDPFLASGMRVLSLIKPDDAMLYVFSIEQTSWKEFLGSLLKLYVGNFLNYRGAKLSYAKKVKVDFNPLHPLIEFDGDVKGYLPAQIEVLPKALEVIVE